MVPPQATEAAVSAASAVAASSAAEPAHQGLAGKNSASPAAAEAAKAATGEAAAAAKAPVTPAAAGAYQGPAGKASAGPAKYSPTSFDPDLIMPKDVDFAAWVPDEQSGKVSKREGKGEKQLAKRLSLNAFSTSIGWRPTGLNVGQARLFIERFPSEFRLGAMAKIVLPCQGGRPFVCPDGRLPCPFLSTCNALRLIEKKRGR